MELYLGGSLQGHDRGEASWGLAQELVHLFWYCKYTQTFWKDTFQWISQNLTLTNVISFSPTLCLALSDSISNLLLHYFRLIARHYIYT